MSTQTPTQPAAPIPWRRELALAAGASLTCLGILLVYRPWNQPAVGDLALFQVFGRLIAHGQVPYRDFFDQKTPFTSYLNAVPALLSRWFGFDYVLGARGLSVVVFALGGGMCYLVTRLAGFDRIAAFVAAVLFLAADGFAWSAAGGFEPKALVSVVGITGLVFAYRQRWLASGLFCALAFLTWQPGGTFLLGAASAVLLTERRQRVRSLASLATGFVAPLAIFVAYLLAAGAFGDFWRDTVTFNRQYVSNAPWPPFGRMVDVINQAVSEDRWLFLLGALGFVLWVASLSAAIVRRAGVPSFAPQAPLAVGTLSVLAYSSVNFGGFGDFFPFVPWVAIWCAWLLNSMRRLGRLGVLGSVAGAIVLAGYGHYTLVEQTGLQSPSPTLGWQRQQVRQLEHSVLLQHDEKLYVTNLAWYLLLSNHQNTTKYYYIWNGVNRFVVDEYGGYSPLTSSLLAGTPKLLVLGQKIDATVRAVARRGYVQIKPKSLSPFLRVRAEYWLRKDAVEPDTTAQVYGPFPTPAGELCLPADLGPAYSVRLVQNQGWVPRAKIEGLSQMPLARLSLEWSYAAALSAGPAQATVSCSATIFTAADVGANWIRLVRNSVCATCRVLKPPALSGSTDALFVIGPGAAGHPKAYAASLTVSRDYLLVRISAELAKGSRADDDALIALVTAESQKLFSRLR